MKTTLQIIDECNRAVLEYDKICRGFWGKPGKDGLARRINFLSLVESLKNKDPEEAVMEINDFYETQPPSSRLRKCIQDALMRVMEVKKPRFDSNVYKNADNILSAEKELFKKVHMIRETHGNTNKHETMLVSLPSASKS